MYQTEYIQSGLVTGTMWDAMMKFIAGGDDRIITSLSSWGNYNNGNVKYTIGNGRYAEINPDNGEMTSKFTTSDGQYHYGINTTAMSEDVKKKKPDPEGFCKAMDYYQILKEDTIIFEDSDVGIEAAEKSGATVFVVRGFA